VTGGTGKRASDVASCLRWSFGKEPLVVAADSLDNADLAEIGRQLNNPLTSLWSLTFQNNTELKTGNDIDGEEHSNNFFFQPFLSFHVGSQK